MPIVYDGTTVSAVGADEFNGAGFALPIDKYYDDALYYGGNFSLFNNQTYVLSIARCTLCSPASNPADLNGDGVVNGADLATLLTNWG